MSVLNSVEHILSYLHVEYSDNDCPVELPKQSGEEIGYPGTSDHACNNKNESVLQKKHKALAEQVVTCLDTEFQSESQSVLLNEQTQSAGKKLNNDLDCNSMQIPCDKDDGIVHLRHFGPAAESQSKQEGTVSNKENLSCLKRKKNLAIPLTDLPVYSRRRACSHKASSGKSKKQRR